MARAKAFMAIGQNGEAAGDIMCVVELAKAMPYGKG